MLAAAAAAKPVSGPVEHLKKVVVEAIRNCPQAEDGTVVVCARDRGIAEGYRLPKLDPRYAASDPTARRRPGEALDGVGAAGTGSCSTVGAGGATGCNAAQIRAWRAQKSEDRKDDRWFAW